MLSAVVLLTACSQNPPSASDAARAPAAPSASGAVAAVPPVLAAPAAPPAPAALGGAAGMAPRLQERAALSAAAQRKLAAPSAVAPMPLPRPMPDRALPAEARDRYQALEDNPVQRTAQEAVSTLSLDVDTAAYAQVRRWLNQGRLPPRDAVRVEELVNYFRYEGGPPAAGHPFAVQAEVAAAPWNPDNLVLRIGVKAVDRAMSSAPPANLVFLVDVSGSMASADKLPLVQASLRQLVQQLRPQDKVSLVTYSGRTQLELPPTSGADKAVIEAAIARLQASGGTAGGQAIQLAYAQARAGFIAGGINRILLATDGDFNIGITDPRQLKDLVARERRSGVSLTTLGFGQGNFNDALMDQLAAVGNGNYSYIDSLAEAQKVLGDELAATFQTVAGDVKLQVEFNPGTVAEWRLIGYENRLLAEADFRNDAVDAVEIGAGKSVTALYELTPVGKPTLTDARRYAAAAPAAAAHGHEWGQVKIRYKQPGASRSVELSQVVPRTVSAQPGADWKFATAVAGFGQLLRGGTHTGQWTYADARTLAQQGLGTDANGLRRDFVKLIDLAQSLAPKAAGSDAPVKVGGE
ncbi:VWA domain-containing protein [Xenophilus sp. Marseille-Q4582]|uniref:vWA domain-containing protein n=1 Tax=Xenophilus sp. Marseille-Q4582 TaxID=2866600 RepID=UPI001CE3BAC3|nr:VWA domain-containing protein [Xenophilus sp. Marseille-Q4582]